MQYDTDDLDEQQRTAAEVETERKIAQANEDADLKWLLSSERGRRIVWRLLHESGPMRKVFDSDPIQMAHNEGRRNFGLWLLERVNEVSSRHYRQMCKEAERDERY